MFNKLFLVSIFLIGIANAQTVDWFPNPPTEGQLTRVTISTVEEAEIEVLCVMFNYSDGRIESIDPSVNGFPWYRDIWFEAPNSLHGCSYCVVTVWCVISWPDGTVTSYNTSRTVRF